MNRAFAIAILLLLVSSLAFSLGQPDESPTPAAERRIEALAERVVQLESELDRIARALEASNQAAAIERAAGFDPVPSDDALMMLAEAISSPEGEQLIQDALAANEGPASGATSSWQSLRDAGMARLEDRQREPDPAYGDHAWRVDRLATDLDLTEEQQETYYGLILDYEERAADLLEESGLNDIDDANRVGEEMRALERERRLLDAEFDEALAGSLDRDQQARYRALPEHRRGLAPGTGADALAARSLGRLWAGQ